MNNRVIHRISNSSYQTINKEKLLLVGIKQEAFENKSKEELLSHCIQSLNDLKLTSVSTK